MTRITDGKMREWLQATVPYTVMILRRAAEMPTSDQEKIIWEHGRRNMELQADGLLPIVCPVPDDSDVVGIGIFAADPEQVIAIMEDDPGVKAGIFSYEVHPCRSLPGSTLPPR
jgi:hypothetical protein